jgi:hypothetical protein
MEKPRQQQFCYHRDVPREQKNQPWRAVTDQGSARQIFSWTILVAIVLMCWHSPCRRIQIVKVSRVELSKVYCNSKTFQTLKMLKHWYRYLVLFPSWESYTHVRILCRALHTEVSSLGLETFKPQQLYLCPSSIINRYGGKGLHQSHTGKNDWRSLLFHQGILQNRFRIMFCQLHLPISLATAICKNVLNICLFYLWQIIIISNNSHKDAVDSPKEGKDEEMVFKVFRKFLYL